MNDDFDFSNPYSSPDPQQDNLRLLREEMKSKVTAPAIFLIVVGALGLAASIFNILYASFAEPQPIDPNAPVWLQEMQKSATGPVTVAIQVVFVIVNVSIIFGAVQMMRMRAWGFALTASILAMVNVGTLCCVLGLPAGIWAIVVLSNHEVKSAFEVTSRM
jgi:type IV secretory pathway VirB2 component (pilin)